MILVIIEWDIISAFERNAEEYDRWYHEELGSLIFESEVKAIEALVLEGYGVEIGVGTGAFSSRLGIPLGLDPALRILKIAKKKRDHCDSRSRRILTYKKQLF